MSRERFRGVLSSADASAGATFTLTKEPTGGSLSVGASDQLFIETMSLASASTLVVSLFHGADATIDAGELIDIARTGSNAPTAARRFEPPVPLQRGEVPRLKCSNAGQIDVVIRGYVNTPGEA